MRPNGTVPLSGLALQLRLRVYRGIPSTWFGISIPYDFSVFSVNNS
jgi:hypothetical protein